MGRETSLQQRIESFIGKELEGRYSILSVLGHGGMGVVYKAQQRLMHRTVAIKMILDGGDDYDLQRFTQEARAVAALSHPNIITVFDFGENPFPYMVMDYLDGYSLSEILRGRGLMHFQEAVHLFCQLCDGLNHAHKKGVIHRDLKPSNIMLIRDEENQPIVKILDFGLARLLPAGESQGPQLTRPGTIFGTPHYMSPEQCMGVPVDTRSDIYSLGCIMYEVLTGNLAVTGENALQILQMHIGGTPLPFNQTAPKNGRRPVAHPPALEKVIFKALRKRPEERQQSMAQLKMELQEALGSSRESRSSFKSHSSVDDSSINNVHTQESSKYLAGEPESSLTDGLPDEKELSLLHSVQMSAERFGAQSAEQMESIEALAEYYSQIQRYAEAEVQYQQLVQIYSSKYGERSKLTADALYNLGFTVYMLDRYDEALNIFKRARAIYSSLWTEPNMDMAWCDYWTFRTYEQMGEIELAGETIEQALDIIEVYVKDPEKLIEWSTLAGEFYEKFALSDKALELYASALSRAEAAYGQKHEQLINPNLKLGDYYFSFNNYEQAEPYYRRATNIAHKTLNSMSEMFAATLSRVGTFYYHMADYAKAKKCFATTLSIDEHNRGKDSIEHVYTLNMLGILADIEADGATAERYLTRAMRICEEHEGPDSARLIAVLRDAGLCAENMRRFDEAEQRLKRSLDLANSHYRDHEPLECANPITDLGRYYGRRKKFDRAEKLLREAIDIIEDNDGYSSYRLILPLRDLAQILTYVGRIEECRKLERRANKIEEDLG